MSRAQVGDYLDGDENFDADRHMYHQANDDEEEESMLENEQRRPRREDDTFTNIAIQTIRTNALVVTSNISLSAFALCHTEISL